MGCHNHSVGHLEVLNQSVTVQNVDAKFPFEGVVHVDAGSDVGIPSVNLLLTALVAPVRLERYRYSIPSLGVDFTESFAHYVDHSLGYQSRLGLTLFLLDLRGRHTLTSEISILSGFV